MVFQSARPTSRDPREPTSRDLNSVRVDGQDIRVRLVSRMVEEGDWRGRLQFTAESGTEVETADILRGTTPDEIWASVQHLYTHHLRDLYRSLV